MWKSTFPLKLPVLQCHLQSRNLRKSVLWVSHRTIPSSQLGLGWPWPWWLTLWLWPCLHLGFRLGPTAFLLISIFVRVFISVDFIGGFDTYSAYQSPAKSAHMQLQPVYVYVSSIGRFPSGALDAPTPQRTSILMMHSVHYMHLVLDIKGEKTTFFRIQAALGLKIPLGYHQDDYRGWVGASLVPP